MPCPTNEKGKSNHSLVIVICISPLLVIPLLQPTFSVYHLLNPKIIWIDNILLECRIDLNNSRMAYRHQQNELSWPIFGIMNKPNHSTLKNILKRYQSTKLTQYKFSWPWKFMVVIRHQFQIQHGLPPRGNETHFLTRKSQFCPPYPSMIRKTIWHACTLHSFWIILNSIPGFDKQDDILTKSGRTDKL